MKTKNWSFHLKDYEALMEKIINFKSDVQIIGLPKIVLQVHRNICCIIYIYIYIWIYNYIF